MVPKRKDHPEKPKENQKEVVNPSITKGGEIKISGRARKATSKERGSTTKAFAFKTGFGQTSHA